VEPERRSDVQPVVRNLNWTTIALVGGLVLLVLLVAYFAATRNPDQDKLTNTELTKSSAPDREKLCGSQATYDLIKRELFRRAAQVRGSDQGAYDRLSGYAVVRMENPVMESQNKDTGAVNCSGSLTLDLPPGVAVVGGRRTLASDIDYTVQQAADGSGLVVQLRNADAIVTPLATLSRVAQPAPPIATPVETNEATPAPQPQEQPNTTAPAPASPAPQPSNSTASVGKPSFNCAKARTAGEVAVCGDAGLSALDRNMAWEYDRAISDATPEQAAELRRTRDRFLSYRDHCPNRACMAQAYVGRMREIRDIVEGR
jgi:hypothetical protein